MKTKPGRSGSQKRKTTARIAVNCTPAQKDAIVEKAHAFDQSPSAICLNMLLDAPLPRRRRQPTVNEQGLTAYLGATAKLKDVLKQSLAELGKSGSNLNQIAYMLNAYTAPPRIMNIIETAVEEHRALEARHDAAIKDLEELRTMAMDVWGLEH
ncbi:MAG: hypothetical protein ABSE42_21415 [Bryobacteraceae bacterium]|jgi:hypothetical protein